MKISDCYVEIRDDLFEKISNFESMLDGHLRRITVAEHQMELSPSDSKRSHPAPSWAHPKAHKFEKHKIEKILSEKVIEQAQTEWTAPIVFAPKIDGSLFFFVHYRHLNAVTKPHVYQILPMDQ